MMGRSHLITGACALGHAYIVSTLIDKAGFAPLISVKQVTESYLGIDGLMQNQASLDSILSVISLYVVMYFIGNLLPDIDNPKSVLGQIIHIPIEHRTWLHAIYLYLIPAALGWFVHPAFSWLFFGVFVHLFWDSFSAAGNCWFYKILSDYKNYGNDIKIKKGHVLKLYHAGEWSEYVLLFIIVAVTVVSVVLINK